VDRLRIPKNNPATIAAMINTTKEIIYYYLVLRKRKRENTWATSSTSIDVQNAMKRKNLIQRPDKSKSST
jgi:hypothetical protein